MEKILQILKKTAIQLVVLVFLSIGNGAEAQYPYEFSFLGIPNTTKTIVRSYDDEQVVVYYEEGGKGIVALVNVISNSVIKVPLDTGYLMNDMCILNDSVYLCGQEFIQNPLPTKFGCILVMDIGDFYTGNVPITCYEPAFYYSIMNYSRIKVFAYTNPSTGLRHNKILLVGDIDYACDGSEPFPHYLNNYSSYIISTSPLRCTMNVVVEATLPYYTTNHPVMRILSPLTHTEVIHDVVITDNYVAFVGVATGTSDSITLHICNKGFKIIHPLIPYPYNFIYYYTYSLGTSSGSPFYHACALDGDNIAIVTQDETSYGSPLLTIRTFNLTTHAMTHSQELKCNSQPYLWDVTYIRDIQRLMIDFKDYFSPYGGYYDVFCTVDPYNINTTYVQQGLSDNVFKLNMGSLDEMRNGYFVTTGGMYGFSADAGSIASGKKCYDVDGYTINKIGTINAVAASYNYDIDTMIDYLWRDTLESLQLVIPSQCIEFK